MAETLVLIHGTNGSGAETEPLARRLPPGIDTFAPDWLGHGGRPAPDEDYGMDAIVDDLALSLDRRRIDRCFLFGYSIGGYAALVLAHRYPERVRGIVTLATRHLWHARGVAHLVHLATPERLMRPGNPRAAELAAIHHPTDWRRVNAANRMLFARLGEAPPLSEADLRAIAVPVLVLNGTADPLVPEEETRALAALFPTWRLGLFEGSAHPFHQTPLDDIATATAGFIGDVAALERA
ncbi:alpha/beta fold hydrolase [Sphingomonas profundi]|uniref:alpha/beta fold hydrolase n=1 Tax=Alterirhizorhabdus profundi TaxID=2681549 RepID=UPI0012E95041|nr:alpha/beta fold hydrolase [Sphingomonas profundi]